MEETLISLLYSLRQVLINNPSYQQILTQEKKFEDPEIKLHLIKFQSIIAEINEKERHHLDSKEELKRLSEFKMELEKIDAIAIYNQKFSEFNQLLSIIETEIFKGIYDQGKRWGI